MSYINSILIKKTSASESYAKLAGENVELNSGSKKTRLQFSSPSSTSAADVYVEAVGKGFVGTIRSFLLSKMDRKFVKSNYGDKKIYININSLSKRIGITKELIYSNAKSKVKFNSMIETHHKKYLDTEIKAESFFIQIINEKYIKDGDEIKTIDEKPISKTELKKMIGIAAFSGFHLKKENDKGYLLKDGRILLLKKQDDSEWPLITLFTNKVLGAGSFGSVRVVNELSRGRISVAKIAHNADVKKDTENENKILNKIVTHIGIQQKPYDLFDFKLNNISFSGYIAPKYDCNLQNIISKLSNKEKIECARQLLEGLVELEKQQIVHGDIKKDNCLFRRKSDGSIECVISDFGGSQNLLENTKRPKYGAPFFRCRKDDIAYSSLLRKYSFENTQNENDKIAQDAKNLVFRRDVFAMGFVINALLSSNSNNERIKPLIIGMQNRSWNKRMSASEALHEFEQIFHRELSWRKIDELL